MRMAFSNNCLIMFSSGEKHEIIIKHTYRDMSGLIHRHIHTSSSMQIYVYVFLSIHAYMQVCFYVYVRLSISLNYLVSLLVLRENIIETMIQLTIYAIYKIFNSQTLTYTFSHKHKVKYTHT